MLPLTAMHIIYSIVRPHFNCEILIIAIQRHEPVIITRDLERGVGQVLICLRKLDVRILKLCQRMHAHAARNCATIIIIIKIGLSVSNANNGVMKHASLLNVERMHLYAISVIIRPRRLGLVANNIEQPI